MRIDMRGESCARYRLRSASQFFASSPVRISAMRLAYCSSRHRWVASLITFRRVSRVSIIWPSSEVDGVFVLDDGEQFVQLVGAHLLQRHPELVVGQLSDHVIGPALARCGLADPLQQPLGAAGG